MKNKPTHQEIQSHVTRVLKEFCRVENEISADSRLREDLKLDSVGLLTLALEVENEWQFVLGEDPQNPPQKVSDIIELVEARIGEKWGHV